MSGSAALSAARKRRASSSTMAIGGGIANTPMSQSGSGSGSYYSGNSYSKPTLQGIMNQNPYSSVQQSPPFIMPKESAPNVPINIYENIELIKHQLSERTKLIQTQGSSIPADKLRVLQKQNEIQTQILKQKLAIAQQMEISEERKQHEQQQQHHAATAQRPSNNAPPVFNTNEPEFIYEKGIPRKNPKYRKPSEEQPQPVKSLQEPVPTQLSYQAQAQAQAPAPATANRKLSPFVCMMTDTGVIPPPVVILKSHDAILSEHHYMIQDMLEQLDYLHSTMKNERSLPVVNKETEYQSDDGQSHADQDDDASAEGDEETELLMEVVMKDLTNSREFVEGIVDKIVNDTNLAEVIMKIEPIVKENQELRALIHSQQQMMNEMNIMLYRLLNQQTTASASASASASDSPSQSTNVDENESPIVYQDEGLNGDGLYPVEITEIILTPSVGQNKEEALAEAQAEAPVEAPVEAQAEAPVEAEVEAPAEAPVEAPVEAEAEAPAPEIQSNEDSSDMPHFPEPISLVVSEL